MGSLKRNLANNILSDGKFDATDIDGALPASNVNNESLDNVTSFGPTFGDAIQSVSSDPTPGTSGDFFFNSTDGKLKGYVNIEAWSNGAPTINNQNAGGGAGTQSSAVFFGGRNPPGPNFVAKTEEYNGTGWTSSGDLNTARSYIAGFGTQTAAVCAGGRTDAPGTTTNATEEYDGSTWTTVNNMGTASRKIAEEVYDSRKVSLEYYEIIFHEK